MAGFVSPYNLLQYLQTLFIVLASISHLIEPRLVCPTNCRCVNGQHETGKTVECTNLYSKEDIVELFQSLPTDTYTLSLPGNHITELPEHIMTLPDLSRLILKYNRISNINHIMSAIVEELRIQMLNIDLGGNNITTLSSNVFKNFTALQSIDIRQNKLKYIQNDTFAGLRNLIFLDLADNKLTTIPHGFLRDSQQLENLDMSNNRISNIHMDMFSGMDYLEELELSGNNLTYLNIGVFAHLRTLHKLSLSHNKLTEVPVDAIGHLIHLKEIDISFNQIRELTDELSKLHNLLYLRTINLQGNIIEVISAGAFNGVSNVTWISLDGNRLHNIDADVLIHLDNHIYGEISFNYNPFVCDCHANEFVTWMKQHTNNSLGYQVPTCVWPYRLHGNKLTDIEPEQLLCAYKAEECSQQSLPLSRKCASLMEDRSLCRDRVSDKRALQANDEMTQTCICNKDSPCYVCPEGSYGKVSANKSEACSMCPVFSTSPYASTGVNQCVCIPGFAGTSSQICTACPINNFKSTLGLDRCQKCVNGETLYEGATTCVCHAGYVENANGICAACAKNTYQKESDCVACPSLSSSAVGSSSVRGCRCNSGYYLAVIRDKPPQCLPYIEEIQVGDNTLYIVSTGIALVIIIVAILVIVIFIMKRHTTTQLSRMESTSTENYYVEEQRNSSNIPLKEPEITAECRSDDKGSDSPYAEWEISRKDLEIIGVVGQGAFGQVLEAKAFGLNGQPKPAKVAVKTLKVHANTEEREALKMELDQLIYVGFHPNIVNLLGACTTTGKLMIIMEYAEMGDLQTFLKTRGCMADYMGEASKDFNYQQLSECDLMSFARQISRGMTHLANVKCVHRDLAARNILVSDGLVVKLSDFGLAREVYESGYYFKETKGRLPYKWMAPEAILFGQYTTKSDVWSYGVLLWEIVTFGGSPYSGIPMEKMMPLLQSGYRMPKPPQCRQEMYERMLACWNQKPSMRPTFSELYKVFDNMLLSSAKQNYMELQPEFMLDMMARSEQSAIGSPDSHHPLLDATSEDMVVTDTDIEAEHCYGNIEPTNTQKPIGLLSNGISGKQKDSLQESQPLLKDRENAQVELNNLMNNIDYPSNVSDRTQQDNWSKNRKVVNAV